MVDDNHIDEEEEEIDDEDSGDPQQAEAKRVLQRMRDSMKGLGEGHDLAKARKYLIDTVQIFKEGKYFEIPNREAVFDVIIDVAKEKYQRSAVLEKVRSAREDITYLEDRDVDVEDLLEVFEEISDMMKEKEYEDARIKFLELDFQITKAKKLLGEDLGDNPLSDPKVKKVIITDDGPKGEDGLEMLPVLEVIDDDYKDEGKKEGKKEKEDEDGEDSGIVWED
jgi:hypothetical protein